MKRKAGNKSARQIDYEMRYLDLETPVRELWHMSKILKEYAFEHGPYSGVGEETRHELDRVLFVIGRVTEMVDDIRTKYHQSPRP